NTRTQSEKVILASSRVDKPEKSISNISRITTMASSPTKQAAVRLKFSVKPVKLNLLWAIILQALHFIQDLVDVLTTFIFRLLNEGKSQPLPDITNPILFHSATRLAADIRNQKLTSLEVVKAYIDRINSVNDIVNAVVDERFDDAIGEAHSVDQFILSGQKSVEEIENDTPFLGVPITIKENFQTVGLLVRKDAVQTEDATAVRLMREAGAIVVAVTNLSELCTWWESNNKVYGRTRNPYDTTRIVGGSSGGEGCIVGSAGSIMGIGTDLGGSIRLPAFFNGVFGHKPTMGLVNNQGHLPALSEGLQSYLVTGPICRYACDLLPITRILVEDKIGLLKLNEKVDLKRLKVYYMENDGGFPIISRVQPEMRKAQRKVILYLERTYGIRAQKVHFPTLVRGLEMWAYTMIGLHKHTFCEEMTNRQGSINVYFELLKCLFGCSNHTLPALLIGFYEKLGIGKRKKDMDLIIDMIDKLKTDFQELLKDDGIFLYPSHPTVAPYHNQPLFQPANFVYAAVYNILGFPVTQCPLGLGTEGLPLGIQVLSNVYNDHITLAVARDLEREFGGWVPPSPIASNI
uniref:Amidase domain-containing protein n=1 Tax=Strigamia maritima TaxID=126957 RepID=T1JI39_STRMM